jgi:1-acyl-sn-glycerol-3-phosphate acyltransferase
MLFVLRFIYVVIYSIIVSVVGCFFCLFSPRNAKHVATFARLFGNLGSVLGIKVERRIAPETEHLGSCIYIANHQNNYDMVTASSMVRPGTVTVGKKSLVWIPFFGQLYWLTGNLLIDRSHRTKAHGTIAQVVKHIQDRGISIWMFPEGTRSRGRGLLPFKNGAFHAAIAAGVPIVPICVSRTHNKIKLNRWNNGWVIIEMLPPIDTSAYGKEHLRELTEHCWQVMSTKIDQLTEEAERRDAEDAAKK